MKEAEFIVVGAGSAGCLLANRLSADPGNRVTLLEAGPPDWDPLITIPLLAAINYFRPSLNWGFETEPQPSLGGQRVPLPRGKVLGGTSAINGMMCMRGDKTDYDLWANMGLSGWSYDDVLPLFKAFERNLSHPDGDAYHGRDGELTMVQARGENPLYSAWIDAAIEAGYERNDDFNGARQDGVGFHDFNIRNGRRVSSAAAFLHPVKRRANLDIVTRAQVTRLLFEGKRCTGVEYQKGGGKHQASATRCVTLCGGVYNSPQILQLSGIGNTELLKTHGIEVVADRPEVGQHFQDHMGLFVEWQCLEPNTLYSLFRPDRAIMAVLRAKLFGTGPGAVIPLEAGALVRTRPELDAPDLQLTFVPGLSIATTRKLQREHGFLTSMVVLRPEGEGYVDIRSADPFDQPTIEPKYMQEEADVQTLRAGVRIVREIVSQPAMTRYRGAEIAPGEAVQSDKDIDDWVRSIAIGIWHGLGTCRMGADEDSVVDAQLRVREVTGLRVADASIMPTSIGGNTSIPSMLIAEKAARDILADSGN